MKSQKSQLPNIIESILFLAGNAVAIKDLSEKLEISDEEVKQAIEELKKSKSEDSGIQVITFKDKVQLTTNANYSEDIATVLNPIKEKALTRAALETVAIVAYKQPITRQEIEDIRGVTSDYAVQVLLTHNLIEVVGRKDAIGKPLMFGTTDEFLKRFELQSLEELPNYDDLIEQVKQINGLTPRDTIYNEFEVVSLEEDANLENQDKNSEMQETTNLGEKIDETEDVSNENFDANEKFANNDGVTKTEASLELNSSNNEEDKQVDELFEEDDDFEEDEDEFEEDTNADEYEDDEEEMDAVDRFLNSKF